MIQTICAILMLTILLALAVFQITLALGKPYGNYAWGGMHTILPSRLRIASGLSVFLYAFFALIVADAAGWVSIFDNQIFIYLLAIYSTVGIFMNGISRSKKERKIMTPVVIIMAICSWLLVLL